ncbi:MAG: PP2C family serine/threonine-protein phosphatase [Vicinamibacterales bacterium]
MLAFHPDAVSPVSRTAVCSPVAAGGFSDRGRRPTNDDCFYVDQAAGLLIVADGMGGHAAGEIAARLATDVVVDRMSRPASVFGYWTYGFDRSRSLAANRLRTAVYAAHMHLVEASCAATGLSGMGTTIVAALRTGDRLTAAWAGDSRLYVLSDDGLACHTRDDSWLAVMRDEGLGDDPGEFHPLRHAVTNAVGALGGVDVHVTEVSLRPGDVVALTTDGVHGALPPRQMAALLARRSEPAHAAADLVAAALGCGSPDNCTAVVASC